MTVAELISELQTMPQDSAVFMPCDGHGGIGQVTSVSNGRDRVLLGLPDGRRPEDAQ